MSALEETVLAISNIYMASRFIHSDAEDFNDFFESSLSGFVITDAEGNIVRINKRVASWLNNS
ncbi:hypothetical protein OKW96_21005 [Sphingobacterium sp. KU25419]|nr:hypothetical protein OKW96_21005 [Sphingobacterium sp. KU25419]